MLKVQHTQAKILRLINVTIPEDRLTFSLTAASYFNLLKKKGHEINLTHLINLTEDF